MKYLLLTLVWVMIGLKVLPIYGQKNKLKPHSSVNNQAMKLQYKKNKSQWDAMYKWVATTDLHNIASGKHKIEGSTLVASVEDTYNEPLSKRGSESHRKHIDFQYVVKGVERFGLIEHSSSKPIGIYNAEGDYMSYEYDKDKVRFMDSKANEYFLFFPSDWHIAKIATDQTEQAIRVVVIKLDYVE